MDITYENQRVVFDVILRKYKEYVALYKLVNNGSLQGVTGFDDFYWRMTYLAKYQDTRTVSNSTV
jgi:hypothetical protein